MTQADDGISGTRFDRESWEQLMADVENGLISTIICKDMSRIGRDHVQVGMYLEIFRRKEVRFIAISNSVDSNDQSTLEFAPFINIMNEWYSRDISRKVRTAMKTKAKNGQYVGSVPPYGYKWSDTNKSSWEIDENTAPIVRRIFQMTIEGLGTVTIARKLSEDKIHSPAYYSRLQEGRTFKNSLIDDPCKWNGPTVNTIVGRLEYTGAMVNLRTEKPSFKDKQGRKLPQEQWLVFHDKHPAIVNQQTWQSANDTLAKKKRTKPNEKLPEHHLTGLLYCATCGSKMHHNRSIIKATGKRRNYYTCKLSKKGSAFCGEHRVRCDHVEELVLETLKLVNGYVKDYKQEFTDEVHKAFASKQADTIKF